MKMDLDTALSRWIEARLLDPEQADRIRQWELKRMPEGRTRWQIVAALAFGGVMLAAGVLLFVSAHWDELSPVQRMALLVGTVGGLHIAGALAIDRFRALGITLHAVGTVALGAAIALAGQIFNMQEHWPTAILLWALGAVAGWRLLGDWPHAALASVLIPCWLAGEFTEAASSRWDAWQVVNCGILLLAITYLSARKSDADPHERTALAWVGGLALFPAAIAVSLEHYHYSPGPRVDSELMLMGWAGAFVLPLAFAYLLRRNAAWANAVAAIFVAALSFAADQRLELGVYACCALGSVGMVLWGIHEARRERINLGMVGFALTIIFFFFSSVMDKLGRSASLIVLGALFLGGGWYWERLRRRLVAAVGVGGVA